MKDILIIRCPPETTWIQPEADKNKTSSLGNDYYVIEVMDESIKNIEFEILKNPNRENQ
jgi:hypothetical protein